MSEQAGSDGPAHPPSAAEPAFPDTPTAATRDSQPPAETAPVAARPLRWQGAAPVPPPAPRRPRWLETAADGTPLPTPAPHPTRPLPPGEQDDEESPTPVDPWAGAELWGPHLATYPAEVAPALPPTRPYPVEPAPPPAPAQWPPPADRPPPPPEPPRRRERRRDQARYDRPQPAPPDWRPPAGYLPVAVRRRRRWPWLLLATLLCCCGVPAYLGGPMAQQYPASATLPAQVAGLSLRDDPASERAANRLAWEMQQTYWPEDTFAGIYSAAGGKRVVIFGATGFRLSPDKDVDAEIGRLRNPYKLRDVQPIDTGSRGQHQRCGVGRWNDETVVVCTWADHGSIASGVFDRLSVDDSARLLDTLRGSIIRRG